MKVLLSKFYDEPVYALGAIEAGAIAVAAVFTSPAVLAVTGAVVGFCEANKRLLVTPAKKGRK